MQFDISSARVEKLIIHKVGNRSREEGFTLSKVDTKLLPEVESILLRNYLGATFKENQEYSFWHETDLKFNEIHSFCSDIRTDDTLFFDVSTQIAKHLYSSSLHPNIAAGDLIIATFSNILVDSKPTSAVGIFKAETKEPYLNICQKEAEFTITKQDGINPSKLQKAALVLDGYNSVLVADKLNNNSRYWIDTFLKARPVSTTTRAAQVATNVFKATLNAIDDPEVSTAYKDEFLRITRDEQPTSIGDLVTISEKYIGAEAADMAARNAASSLDINYIPEAEIEKTKLERSIRPYTKKIRIATGVDLLIASGVNIKSVKRKSSSDSRSLTIDIQLAEK